MRSARCPTNQRSRSTPRLPTNALADAGLTRADVDGLLTAGYANYDLADYLGIAPRYTDTTTVGGASFVIHVGHAVNAIASGLCEVALITHGQAGRSSRAPIPATPTCPPRCTRCRTA